ncbi:MAG TPA: carboxypeptidase regulatory-like domain-containing protein [Vicinamibacterales bacterium]|nr:carboxypeptidase regulatory-like domain-containing protein [Vicinamibacterales bacterium]
MNRIGRLGLLAWACVLVSRLAVAQPAQIGTLAGTVTDDTGGVMPGVSVTLSSQDRGIARATVTDGSGRYLFAAVPIGTYGVTAQLSGFESAQRTDNVVETEKTTTVAIVLRVGQLTDTVRVTGEVPLVDMTNVAANTRIRHDQFEKLPIGRSYQSLIGAVPGVVGTGNVNALGALTSHNQFLIDSVDTTDPATGTFATSLNFEAIQEISVYTAGASAEYGRAQGAIVNVVTKSGTNSFEGSFKYIFANDAWDAQNSTVNQVTGASLARDKFNQVNPSYALTSGGPILRNRAWYFVAYERQENTTPQRQTVGTFPENYQQVTESDHINVRGTVQIDPSNNVWVKYYRTPTNGYIIDYWGNAAGERAALTAQNQTAENWAAQWSGVLRNNWTMEAAFADYTSRIDVGAFQKGPLLNGAAIFNQADNRYYNGGAFEGYVARPRRQFNAASTWYITQGPRSHSVKAGADYQAVESGAQFDYPNRQLYQAASFDQSTGTMVPLSRGDYESGDSTSTGRNLALYVRDKFQVTPRLFVEGGVRYENQSGKSDVGAVTVKAATLSPRVSGSYDLGGDGKSLVQASYGRYYVGIIQSFSDGFAAVPQQTNYDNYVWNGAEYLFSNSVRLGASSFRPNTDLRPYFMDEYTLGYQQQFGRTMAVGARFISRGWGDLIDDVRSFAADGSVTREVVNYDPAERTYRGVQFTLERRFADNWSASASYTYSQTRGNHFGNTFTALGDYVDAQCRTTVDPTVGTAGVIPCAEVQNGSNKFGAPSYDRPHNLKVQGAYVKPLGPASLVVGGVAESISKQRYERSRTFNVLRPGTLTNAGPTATYYYEPLGSSPVSGMAWLVDAAVEITWKVARSYQAGFKSEIFNITNQEAQLNTSATAWCGSDAGAGCSAAIANFGKATARGQYQQPRRYRFSLILRF